MLNKEQIFDIIQRNQCPYWKLMLKETPWSKAKVIADYSADGMDEEKTSKEGQVEQSISALQANLAIYASAQGITFEIIVRPTKTSNGEKVLGPFAFSLTGGDLSQSMPGAGLPVGGTLNGLPGAQAAPPAGYVSLGEVQNMLANSREASRIDVERALLERDKKDWEEQKKAEEEELQEKYKEYSDVTEAAEKAAKRGARKALIEAINLWGDGKEVNLGGTNEKSEMTDEEKVLQRLVDHINEQNFTLEELTKTVEAIIPIIKKMEANS